MLSKALGHLRRQWMGALALFLVLSGGTAWAVDEWTGANIQDGTLTSADYKNNDVRSIDVRNDNVAGGGLGGADIAANALTGADIDESSLGEVPSAANAAQLQGKTLDEWSASNVVTRAGPLPIESTFTSHGGDLLIIASGSGFRASDNTRGVGWIGMPVKLDGTILGGPSVFANERGTHKAFITRTMEAPGVAAGQHTIRLEAGYDSLDCNTDQETVETECTTTDNHDLFNVSVIEMP